VRCEPITKPVRHRSRAHLAYVGSQPCCIPHCRGTAVQVHHLGHAQPKARGLKAGDQHVVSLCVTHHLGTKCVHSGREADWWDGHGVDAIAVAERLWADSVAAGWVKP
jgi:hypothetical protein